MPPRRRKVVCDDDEEKEAVPVKKSRQKTETPVVRRAEKMSSKSKNAVAGLSPVKKLRKKLSLKEGSEVSGSSCVVEEIEEEEVTESKYFRDGYRTTIRQENKETKARKRSGPKKADPGKGEKLGRSGPLRSKQVGQAARKGKGAEKAGGEIEEGAKDDEMEDDVPKRERRKKRLSKPEAEADDSHGQSSGDVGAHAKKSRKASAVTCQKKKSAPGGGQSGQGRAGKGQPVEEDEPLASSSSESEWEEVEELPGVDDVDEPWKSQLPDRPVEITFDSSELVKKKRKKGGFDMKEFFRLQLNRFRTETQRNAHKVHLLCLLSHGRCLNSVCCSVMLQSIALSLVPPEFTGRSCDAWTLQQLTMFTRWLKKTILIDTSESAKADFSAQLSDRLVSRFSEQKALSLHEFILMFTICSRSIGLLTRLVYSLQPITFKPADLKNKSSKSAAKSVQKKRTESKKSSKKNSEISGTKTNSMTGQNSPEVLHPSSAALGNRNSSSNADSQQEEESQSQISQSEESQSNAGSELGRSRSGTSCKKAEETSLRTESNILKTKNRRPRRSGSKVNYDEGTKCADLESEEDDWNEEMGDGSGSASSDPASESGGRKSGRRKRTRSSDDDFESTEVAFRHQSTKKLTKRQKRRQQRRRQSEASSVTNYKMADDKESHASFGSDWWTEIYLEKEHKWISINGSQLQVNQPESVEKSTANPLSYILAFDDVGGIKDVTKKYASEWLSSVKKVRVDESWWKDVLAPFQKEDCERDVREEEYVNEQLLKKPMPTTISDFKNHSLYALRRHLLKYEAIYPPTAPVLGQIRGESVYARDCVHCLHSREKWLLEGRLVRVDEEPYKIVKARPKWNKPKEFNDRLKLSLFGLWQTEEFIPLPVVNGKIPKNEYGNVEVFKPWMIPSGAIHLSEAMSGLGRVAKKLDVDVAPAMIGWDFHGGFNHPIFQGWIVCEEHRDVLVAAWEEDQAIQQQKEAEKKQQRVLGNWKLLIRGLLIRERLKKRFDLEEPTVSKKHSRVQVDLEADNSEEETSRGVEDTATKEEALSWPENLKRKRENRTEEKKNGPGKAADSKHNLFPFEKDHQLSSSANL